MPSATPSAPAAPAAAPIRIESAPIIKSGLPPGRGIVEVPGAAVDPGPGSEPPKKGTAKSRMFDDLQKTARVNSDPGAARVTPPAKPAVKPAVKPAAEAPKPEAGAKPEDENLFEEEPGTQQEPTSETPAGEPAADPKAGESTPAIDPKTGKPPKANPWKLFEAEKAARVKAEKEAQDLRSSIVPEAERKTLLEAKEKAEKRAEELEKHIRYVDYEKSAEFQEKYDKPYKDAWARATAELKDLVVNTGQGERPIQTEDILELVNMKLPDAITTAKQVFGDAADYVLAHRKEIRNLYDAQAKALKEARENGVSHFKKKQEEGEKWQRETNDYISKTWESVNKAALEDPKTGEFFKPREGDQDWNQRLAKGFEMVDRAFNENPRDPKLTPEQRAQVVRRHAAIRHRAAGWGPLKHENTKLRSEMAEMRKELEGYKGSEPVLSGKTPPAPGTGQPVRARDRMMSDLAKLAKPV